MFKISDVREGNKTKEEQAIKNRAKSVCDKKKKTFSRILNSACYEIVIFP